MVIDPIKNASHNIKHFLKNKTKKFKNSESITFNKELQHIMVLYYTFHNNNQSESDSELELSSSNFLVNSAISSELTDSESVSDSSESDDSSESSESVSE